jgi:hypothetical protein
MRNRSPAHLALTVAMLFGTAVILLLIAPVSQRATAGSHLSSGSIIYVDHTATGSADGSSWANAFTDLQPALAAAIAGDEIWVAAGVYKPTADPAQRTATFQLKNGVALYGGFAGTEGARQQRNWLANLTVLSGDIEGNDVTSAGGVVTNPAHIVGANSYHVVTGSGADSSAILDAFTITAGNATGLDPYDRGGGLYNNSGHPTLANLIFSGNSAASNGGGMHNVNGSNPSLTAITFRHNSASSGGGLYNVNNSHPTLINVIFSGNSAAVNGGGMYNVNDSSPTLINAVFSGNRAAGSGGGMYNVNLGNPNLINASFSGNHAAVSGGGMYNALNSPLIQNSIFWNNGGGSIANLPTGSPTIRFSLVEGCNPGGVWNSSCGVDGGDNLADANPLFVSTPDPGNAPTLTGNLRLQIGSPAIDAGDNGAVSGVTTDLDGNPRILGPAVDLGPYEGGVEGCACLYLPLVLNRHTLTAAASTPLAPGNR